MRKYAWVSLLCSLLLISCIETVSDTLIKSDGSGEITATVDLSAMMKMLAGKKATEEEKLKIDTVIHMRDHSDTASGLSDYQKSLLRGMKVKMLIRQNQRAV